MAKTKKTKTKKPTDFVIRFGDFPITFSELERWKPGLMSEMGFVEALTWIPVYLGQSEEPVSLDELNPVFAVVAPPSEDEPSYEFHKLKNEKEDQLMAISAKLGELHGLPETEEIIEQREAIRSELHMERFELIEADKNYSMVSKLSK